MAGPLSLAQADLPIDPYLLGVWLGNGSALMNQITIHEDDVAFSELLGDCGFDVQFRLPQWRKGKVANLLVDGGRSNDRDACGRYVTVAAPLNPSFMSRLQAIDLVNNKHVPASYLRASVSQRLVLRCGTVSRICSTRPTGTKPALISGSCA